ncbi:MAG TPA: tRNA pseudouridine(38-40) synthase TruA [Gammaproteobacteria bacterium]|nr:tRNA pseudouridine(38-40) synthase TruA [Gammaproteobacteria bacterium]
MKIAAGIEYDGHDFFGWQAQKGLPTIQGHLQDALSRVADEPIQVFCAGRTDAGVHATGQVVHFETAADRALRAWTMGANSYLPLSIAVKWAVSVDEAFHARFSALSRRYRYVIDNSPTRPAISARRVTWHPYPLDAAIMHEAAQSLIGEQDFSSFRSSECESKTPMRNIHFIRVTRSGNFIVIDIQANAFLHHMVRNIAGVLLKVGGGLQKPRWIKDVLYARDRRMAAETASPTGLYLCEVKYPESYDFPPEDGRFGVL